MIHQKFYLTSSLPQQTLVAIEIMKFESLKRFLNVSFCHNFTIFGKNSVTAQDYAILIKMHANFSSGSNRIT